MKTLRLGAEAVIRITSNPYVYFGLCLSIALGVAMTRVFYPWTSPFDEHTHLSYVQYAYSRIIPANGYEMNWWAKQAFSCHPHAMYGAMTQVPCGTVDVGAKYPTGGTNTSQTWPPLYFIIVGTLMRIPLMWIHDPLIAARFITAILWSLGVAWIAYQVWKLTNHKAFGLVISALLVALPTFFYYTSNVSPHSLNPLLFGFGLFISIRILKSTRLRAERMADVSWHSSWKTVLGSPWPYALVVLGVVCAISIPQSLSLVALCALFSIFCVLSASGLPNRLKAALSILIALTATASLGLEYGIFKVWQWQVSARSIPFAAGVNTAGGNSDPADPQYSNLFDRAMARWWSFWPNGLTPGWPDHQYATTQVTLWMFILTGLSVAAVAIWQRSSWLGPLMLALLVTAPVFSIAYDFFFTTDVPARYGMLFPIAGVLSIANTRASRPFRLAIVLLAAGTYIWALWLENPFYFPASNCHLGAVTHLIYCYQ